MLSTAMTPSADEQFYHACIAGNFATLEKLLENNSINIDTPNKIGIPPLVGAIMNLQYNVMNYLLASGANIDAKDSNGCAAIHFAATYKDIRYLELLVQYHTNTNFPDNKGDTPSHFAAKNGRTQNLKYLFAHNANGYLKNHNGLNPLHLAAQKARYEILPTLTEHINISTLDDENNTALILAGKELHSVRDNEKLLYRYTETIRTLIECGANINNERDIKGNTILHEAYKFGNEDIIKFLLRKGANPNSINNDGQVAQYMGEKIYKPLSSTLLPIPIACYPSIVIG